MGVHVASQHGLHVCTVKQWCAGDRKCNCEEGPSAFLEDRYGLELVACYLGSVSAGAFRRQTEQTRIIVDHRLSLIPRRTTAAESIGSAGLFWALFFDMRPRSSRIGVQRRVYSIEHG